MWKRPVAAWKRRMAQAIPVNRISLGEKKAHGNGEKRKGDGFIRHSPEQGVFSDCEMNLPNGPPTKSGGA